MLIPLISTIWLATLVFAMATCRMAAHGDRPAAPRARFPLEAVEPSSKDARSPSLLHLRAPWEGEFTIRLSDRRPAAAGGRSETAAAEHVGNGAQEDLYVRP